MGMTLSEYDAIQAANDNRRGNWLQTYTGRQFWPMDPRAEDVAISDIAHSLAMQCRYAGHCKRFYSVAEHSIVLSDWCKRHYGTEIGLWALLHDASEAYLVDVPRPVKPYLTGYAEAERAVMAAICDKFDLPHEMPPEVHEADGRIIADERENMAPCAAEWAPTGEPLGVAFSYWSPAWAEAHFMMAFNALMFERSVNDERRTA